MAMRWTLVFLLTAVGLFACKSAPPAGIDYVLLHNGDFIEVRFNAGEGGEIRFLSLTETSMLDVEVSSRVKESFLFKREEGWRIYPRSVVGQVVRVILREGSVVGRSAEMPVDSDVQIRVTGGQIREIHHPDPPR